MVVRDRTKTLTDSVRLDDGLVDVQLLAYAVCNGCGGETEEKSPEK
jgi:hypothetical protein